MSVTHIYWSQIRSKTWGILGKICPAYTTGQCKYGNDCKLAHETELATDGKWCDIAKPRL